MFNILKSFSVFIFLIAPVYAFASVEGEHDWAGLYWRIAMFVLFVILIVLAIGKKISAMTGSRRDEIISVLHSAETELDEANIRLEEHRVKMSKLDSELSELSKYAKDTTKVEIDALLIAAGKQIEFMREKSKATMDNEVLKAIADIRKGIAFESIDKAELLIKKEIKADKGRKIDMNYIKNIGNQ